MLGSLSLGRLLGIEIRCSWTFLLLLPLVLRLRSSPLESLLFFLALFVSVLLHEMGHAVVARRFGIQVVDITFWPLGGMARMSEIPESPRIEGGIALAGPAVNGALALLGALVLLVGFALGGGAGDALAIGGGVFAAINAALCAFNLLPAFPMDGGRVLRCLFARRSTWVDATARAVSVGRWVAAGLVVLSFFVPGFEPLVMLLVALFIWGMGARELLAVRLRHGLSPFARALGGLVGTDAARPADWRAAEPGGNGAAAAAEAAVPWGEPVEEQGSGSARRPLDWDGSLGQRGFTDEDVRRLERFRGRLPRE